MSDMIKVSICDGKYTIIQDASGRTNVLRYGEAWRDVTGDNVILGAAYEIEKLQERIKQLEDNRTMAAANSLANMLSYEDAVAKIKRLEELGNKLRECASQLGWTSSEDTRWIERAEAAVKAWDKEAKP